jgi:hypothetical protein
MAAKIPTIAKFLETIGIGSIEATKAADILADIEIGKSVAQHEGAQEVKVLWDQGNFHSVPTREEIKVGPTEHASGGGAEKMVRDYSRPAPQEGTTLESERLAGELGQMRGYMKARDAVIDKLASTVAALTTVTTAVLAKAAGDVDGDDTPEVDVFARRSAVKAEHNHSTARRLLLKAKRLSDDLDDLEGEPRKLAKSQIKTLRQQAVTLLGKAQEAAFAAKSGEIDPALEVRKSIRALLEDDLALKADVSAFHEKGDGDEEKRAERKLKKMAKKAAAKAAAKAEKKKMTKEHEEHDEEAKKAAAAKSDAKGNQADKQDEKTGNQDDEAAKAQLTGMADQISKAAAGLGMLNMTVSQMLETVAAKPVTHNVGETLALMKGEPGEIFLAVNRRIEAASNVNQLDQNGVMKATDLLSKLTAVRAGSMSQDVWQSQLNAAPAAVRQVFAEAA